MLSASPAGRQQGWLPTHRSIDAPGFAASLPRCHRRPCSGGVALALFWFAELRDRRAEAAGETIYSTDVSPNQRIRHQILPLPPLRQMPATPQRHRLLLEIHHHHRICPVRTRRLLHAAAIA